jgi:rhomboid protease GluP
MDPLTVDNIRATETHKVLFISGNRRMKNPKDENYFDMLKDLCCPAFKCFSFTTIVLIVTLVMYVVELSMGLNKAGSFLEVQTSTLLQLGANYAPYIRQGQVYRLIAPIFLHINFLHFFGNMLAIFMFVTRIEHSFGLVRTFLIYMLSGIGGNIFSALIDSTDVKAGASTSLYGMIGVIIGYMIINWSGLDIVGPIMKYQLCCTSVMIIMFIFFFSVLGTGNVDVFGHLGGLMTGLFLSSINETIKNETYEKVIRIVLISLFVIMYVICFAIFFTK